MLNMTPPVSVSDSLAEEFNLQYSALPAETETGGVMFNIVPKNGGNQYKGSFFGNFATSGMQAKNASPAQVAQGLDTAAGSIDYITDINPSFGGPIKRDRLWFFLTYRDLRPYQYSIMHYDANRNDYVYT